MKLNSLKVRTDLQNNKKNEKFIGLIWLFAFIGLFIFILYKCPFGFSGIDESFYLTIPYRLVKGDGLFAQEWHLSQLSSLLLYPFVKLYLSVFDTTEGICLSFRYIFTVIHAFTSLLLYLLLRKQKSVAYFVSLVYLCFTPFGIMALSYNSMGLGLLLLACAIIYSNSLKNTVKWLISGVAFAFSVLCCPYLLILYVLFAISCIVCSFIKRKKGEINKAVTFVDIKSLVLFTAGCAVVAVLFFIFVLSRCSLKEIFDNIPYILDDPEHKSRSIFRMVFGFIKCILNSNILSPVICVGSVALFGIILFDKNREKRKNLYFLIALVLTVVYTIPFFINFIFINHLMFPLNILGFFCFVLSPKKNIKEMLCLWIPGMIYGFCISCSSNQAFNVVSNAALISTVGSIAMIFNFCSAQGNVKESGKKSYNVLKITSTVLLCLFIIGETSMRYNSLFWERNNKMSEMTHKISVGAEKGIVTNQKMQQLYESLYDDTKPIREYKGDSVLYVTFEHTWLWLDDKKDMSAYSAWISGGYNEASCKKMIQYFELNPSKIPSAVYIGINDVNKVEYLIDYLNSEKYKETKTENGYIYYSTKNTA